MSLAMSNSPATLDKRLYTAIAAVTSIAVVSDDALLFPAQARSF